MAVRSILNKKQILSKDASETFTNDKTKILNSNKIINKNNSNPKDENSILSLKNKKYVLGRKSRNELIGVHADLVKVVNRAIEITSIDFSVHDGIRTIEEQTALVKSGASRTLESRHITGHAVDLIPIIKGKMCWDWEPIYQIAEAVRKAALELKIPIRWGGSWDVLLTSTTGATKDIVSNYVKRRKEKKKKAFIDGPHYELPKSKYPIKTMVSKSILSEKLLLGSIELDSVTVTSKKQKILNSSNILHKQEITKKVREKVNNKKPINERYLSENFKFEEFLRSDEAQKHAIINEQENPPDKIIMNLKYLVKKTLQPIRSKLKTSIHINSGYRCRKLNKLVGGSKSSQHIKGEAADCILSNNFLTDPRVKNVREDIEKKVVKLVGKPLRSDVTANFYLFAYICINLKELDIDQVIHEEGEGFGAPGWIHISSSKSKNRREIVAIGSYVKSRKEKPNLKEALAYGT